MNVITVLNKCCVEHNPEQNLIAEALMHEHNLCIASHRKRLFLVFGKHECYFFIILSVLLNCRKAKYFSHLHSLAVVNDEAWSASCPRYFRYFVELNSRQPFNSWWLNLFFVIALKIVKISQLARLTDTLAASKSPMPLKTYTVINWIAVAHIK